MTGRAAMPEREPGPTDEDQNDGLQSNGRQGRGESEESTQFWPPQKRELRSELEELERDIQEMKRQYEKECLKRGVEPYKPVSMDDWVTEDLARKFGQRQNLAEMAGLPLDETLGVLSESRHATDPTKESSSPSSHDSGDDASEGNNMDEEGEIDFDSTEDESSKVEQEEKIKQKHSKKENRGSSEDSRARSKSTGSDNAGNLGSNQAAFDSSFLKHLQSKWDDEPSVLQHPTVENAFLGILILLIWLSAPVPLEQLISVPMALFCQFLCTICVIWCLKV